MTSLSHWCCKSHTYTLIKSMVRQWSPEMIMLIAYTRTDLSLKDSGHVLHPVRFLVHLGQQHPAVFALAAAAMVWRLADWRRGSVVELRLVPHTRGESLLWTVNYSFFLVTVKVSQWAYLLVTVWVSKSNFLKHIVTIVTVSDRVCCYFVELRRYGHQLEICGRWIKKHVPLAFFDLVVQAWILWTEIWGDGLIFGCISQAFDFFL